ncbi:ketoacyl-ACP synthase III [Streptomyces sp. LHD-70]|uniref:3-oxoacyl-ACP synthase III family protein n=1 Tax=Streptomyces sp. LHD-70 TaxID=3072140 RepID=UPI00280D7A9C|nr:ketoacyl-ACP synthase III [Streptomyces sp. LHD-70]MDQ8707300.1 ketoacyl-ACP synthase III [Streptomyces sp. LHD-70]
MADIAGGTGAPPIPVSVLGTGSHVPSLVITNDDVGAEAGVTDEWIVRKTGIHERRYGKGDEATSDLAAAAARAALEDAGVAVADLSLIIVATSTPDSPQPPTATVVADLLHAPSTAAAFDLNSVCSGFVYALTAAASMIAGGGHALVIGADMYSRITDPTDPRTRVLWGDGAGAVVLGPATGRSTLTATRLLTHTEGRELIQVPAGGTRLGTTAETLAEGLHYFAMNGRGVKEMVYATLPEALRTFLDDAGIDAAELAHIVPHQANAVMLAELHESLPFPRARMHTTVTEYGNTGAASIPLTLDAAARQGALRPGEKVLLCAFGGGFNFGFAVIEW